MKTIKKMTSLALLFIVVASFSQCSSAKNAQESSSLEIIQAYCQRWIGGVEGGGSGLNIFIQTMDNSIRLDSVYFRGKGAKFETKPQSETLYIGRFMSDFNQKKDMIMTSEPKGEFGNEAPQVLTKIPFELKDNECMVSYQKNGSTIYFKIENVVEKELIPYPSAPPIKQ